MLFDGLTVVANPRRLLNDPSFRAFVNPIVDERAAFGEGHDLEAAIMEVCPQRDFPRHVQLPFDVVFNYLLQGVQLPISPFPLAVCHHPSSPTRKFQKEDCIQC